MTMRVLYFAWLRERVGIPEETVTPPAEVRTVSELVAWLRGRSPQHSVALADPAIVRVAVKQDYARPDNAVGPDDEIAIFRSEEKTSELQSLMRISHDKFCMQNKTHKPQQSKR